MGLLEVGHHLKNHSGDPVLSVYLSTAPDKRGQWEKNLRNEKKRLSSKSRSSK